MKFLQFETISIIILLHVGKKNTEDIRDFYPDFLEVSLATSEATS